MIPGPIALLREALENLAAEPVEQERRLSGMVVRDELALDFENAFAALASLSSADALDPSTMADLAVLEDMLDAEPSDSLWSESLDSPRWSEARSLSGRLLERV